MGINDIVSKKRKNPKPGGSVRHLLREYENRKGVGECGRKGLNDSEVSSKACEVTCPKCQGTKAFAKAAKHPFFGLNKPKAVRKRNVFKETEKKVEKASMKAKRTGKPVVIAEQKPKERRSEVDLWDDVLLEG